ncbi:MAG: ATPase, T2SS/T4P/T4SS family [Anaerolineae bacterium]
MSSAEGDIPRKPRLYAGAGGSRMFSQAALIERVVDEFMLEFGAARPGNLPLTEAATSTARLKLIRDVLDYVLGVESIQLTLDERAGLVRAVYGELFGYGPLDPLLSDPRVTSIVLAGDRHAAVRYQHGEMTRIEPLFEDSGHLRSIVDRLLADAGTELDDRDIVIECGLRVGNRPVRLGVAAPPLTPVLYADLRLHPDQPPSLEELHDSGWMSDDGFELIRRIAASPFGFAIVGEPETGKTTLLNALLPLMGEGGLVLERARELRPPQGVRHWGPGQSDSPENAVTFADWVRPASLVAGRFLAVDEVRGEDPDTVAPLLEPALPPRQIWVVRGVPDAKRLQSAMGMLARRAAPDQGEDAVHALYERLPFVITLARIRERLQVFSIAEWQSRADSDYPDYVMLCRYSEGASRPTGAQLARWLD